MRFSLSNGCFYPEMVAYTSLPEDIVTVPDEDYVLAQNRKPGERLDLVDGRIVILPPLEITLAEVKSDLCDLVDGWAERTRLSAIGNETRAIEYQVVAAGALAFRDANYLGTPPAGVATWMSVANLDAKAATDNILEMRDQYLSGILTIRDIRLRAKASIRTADTADAAKAIADEAHEQFDIIMAIVANI